MKKVLFTLVLMLTAFSAKAMSYQQARDQALFLTDKMAYELDLTEEQYEAAFEVNLDYLMSVNTVDDVYSVYWTRRNLALSYILYDWQYRTFCVLEYFYRPTTTILATRDATTHTAGLTPGTLTEDTLTTTDVTSLRTTTA